MTSSVAQKLSKRGFLFGSAAMASSLGVGLTIAISKGVSLQSASVQAVNIPSGQHSPRLNWQALWDRSALGQTLPLAAIFKPKPLVQAEIEAAFPKPLSFYSRIFKPKNSGSILGAVSSLPSPSKAPLAAASCRPSIMPCAISDAIVLGAKKSGLGPDFLAAVAWIESRFNPRVRNTSTATGLFQFLGQTWLSTIFLNMPSLPDEYRAKLDIFNMKYGPGYTKHSEVTQEVLQWRYNPEVSAIAAGLEMRANGRIISSQFGGKKVTKTDLYLSHALGVEGACSFLEAMADKAGVPEDFIGGNAKLINGANAEEAYNKLRTLLQSKSAEFKHLVSSIT